MKTSGGFESKINSKLVENHQAETSMPCGEQSVNTARPRPFRRWFNMSERCTGGCGHKRRTASHELPRYLSKRRDAALNWAIGFRGLYDIHCQALMSGLQSVRNLGIPSTTALSNDNFRKYVSSFLLLIVIFLDSPIINQPSCLLHRLTRDISITAQLSVMLVGGMYRCSEHLQAPCREFSESSSSRPHPLCMLAPNGDSHVKGLGPEQSVGWF